MPKGFKLSHPLIATMILFVTIMNIEVKTDMHNDNQLRMLDDFR